MPTPRPFSLILLGAFAALSLAASAAYAQGSGNDTDWKKGKWEHLAPKIGTYDYETVLNDPEVSAKLDAMLGADKERLINNLFVHDAIGFEKDCLVLQGNANAAGNTRRAYLNVCLYAGDVHAALWGDNAIMLYTTEKKYEYLPPSLRAWAYLVKNQDAFDKAPAYVQTITTPR